MGAIALLDALNGYGGPAERAQEYEQPELIAGLVQIQRKTASHGIGPISDPFGGALPPA